MRKGVPLPTGRNHLFTSNDGEHFTLSKNIVTFAAATWLALTLPRHRRRGQSVTLESQSTCSFVLRNPNLLIIANMAHSTVFFSKAPNPRGDKGHANLSCMLRYQIRDVRHALDVFKSVDGSTKISATPTNVLQ